MFSIQILLHKNILKLAVFYMDFNLCISLHIYTLCESSFCPRIYSLVMMKICDEGLAQESTLKLIKVIIFRLFCIEHISLYVCLN